MLITGDLVNAGGIDEYQQLRTLLERLALRWYPLVGNHDDRANLQRVFGERAELVGDGFVQYAFDADELRVIALDTFDPGSGAGRLCASRFVWLEAQLDACRESPC